MNDNFLQGLIKYANYLPPEENHHFVVLVLKWHLLIEEELRQIVLKKFVDKKVLDLKQTKFSMLLKLSIALYGGVLEQWEWDIANQLNVVRNSLAHSLEDEKLALRIEEKIFNLFDENDPVFPHAGNDQLEKIAYCFSYIHTAVLRVKHNESEAIAYESLVFGLTSTVSK